MLSFLYNKNTWNKASGALILLFEKKWISKGGNDDMVPAPFAFIYLTFYWSYEPLIPIVIIMIKCSLNKTFYTLVKLTFYRSICQACLNLITHQNINNNCRNCCNYQTCTNWSPLSRILT